LVQISFYMQKEEPGFLRRTIQVNIFL